MSQKIKLVIFDLDGTLVDAYESVTKSLNTAFKKMNLPAVDVEMVKRSVGWGEKNLLDMFVPAEKYKELQQLYREYQQQDLKNGIVLLSGVKDLLENLKAKGYKLALATNRPSGATKIILDHLGIIQYFDCILCGDDVPKLKPAPDLIQKLLEKFSLPKDEVIFIGDMTVDVQTGFNAGIKTIAVTTGSSTHEEVARLQPFCMVNGISSVESVIDAIV